MGLDPPTCCSFSLVKPQMIKSGSLRSYFSKYKLNLYSEWEATRKVQVANHTPANGSSSQFIRQVSGILKSRMTPMHYSSSKELVSGMYVPCTILDWLHICTHTHTHTICTCETLPKLGSSSHDNCIHLWSLIPSLWGCEFYNTITPSIAIHFCNDFPHSASPHHLQDSSCRSWLTFFYCQNNTYSFTWNCLIYTF